MADNGMSSHEARQRMTWGAGISIGMVSGVGLGATLDNWPVGIGFGVLMGIVFVVALGLWRRRRDVRRAAAADGPDDLGREEGPGDSDR
ncbi:MAG: hypothetical protein ACQEW8_10510 [Actinomycetota bacterium]